MGAGLLAAIAAAAAAAGPLDYAARPFRADLREVRAGRGWTEYELSYPSPVKSGVAANDEVRGHYFVPDGPGPHAAVLVLPVMAAPNIEIERRFIERFRADGLAVLWLEMPYQFQRRPHPSMPSGQVFLARTAKRLAFNFRQSCLDARRALDWLSRRPELDRARIGVFGISLGALVGSAVYSVDATPSHGVFLLGGADFPSLVVGSSMTGGFVRKAGIRPEDVRKAWKGIDPLDYRASNKGKKALLINVRRDTVIPAVNARKLQDAFPDARQVWLPLGHYTAILHLLWVPRFVSKEFQRAWGRSR